MAEEKKKWLSNITKNEVAKIKEAFPKVIEGMPKAAGGRGVEDLYNDGIVGLYLGENDGKFYSLDTVERVTLIVTGVIAVPFHLLCKATAFFAYALYMGFKEGWQELQ